MKGQQSNGESRDVEEVFMNSFWEEVNKFRVEESDDDDESGQIETPRLEAGSVVETPNFSLDLSRNDEVEEKSFLSGDMMGEMDALLSMAFEQYVTDTTQDSGPVIEIDEESTNCHRFYEK